MDLCKTACPPNIVKESWDRSHLRTAGKVSDSPDHLENSYVSFKTLPSCHLLCKALSALPDRINLSPLMAALYSVHTSPHGLNHLKCLQTYHSMSSSKERAILMLTLRKYSLGRTNLPRGLPPCVLGVSTVPPCKSPPLTLSYPLQT